MDKLQSLAPSPQLALFTILPLATLYHWLYFNPRQEDAPPYIVSATWPLSLISHIRSVFWNETLAQRGYGQYREGMFKMPFFGQWVTVVGPKYVKEIVHAPLSSLSFQQNLNNHLQLDLLIGPTISKDQMHLTLIRILNKNLDEMYTEIQDETQFAVEEVLATGKADEGWISVNCSKFVDSVVLSLNHRAFVGLPDCRDAKWRKAMTNDADDMARRALFLGLFSKSKRPTINKWMNFLSVPLSSSVDTVARLVNERLALPEDERSNDLLSWIVTRMPEHEPDPRTICGVFQIVMNVAQTTTSMSLGHTLFHLVSDPECVTILREEIENALDGGELTRQSLDHMHKLDSFLRETQRLSGLSNFTLGRIAMQDFQFSNGIRVPAGELVQAMSTPMHHDAFIYPEPLEFKPWRFYDLAHAGSKNADGANTHATSKHEFTATSETFLAWGLGRNACPGRWYAAMILKHLMAYLILNYDIKLPESAKGKRPDDLCFASARIPNPTANILFKRRKPDPSQ